MPENLFPLCGDGAQGCHGEVEFRTEGYRERVRARLSGDQVAYVIERKGAAWLNRNYPKGAKHGRG
jgi:hypothetical protein